MFKLSDLVPGSDELTNSGLPLYCPICQTNNLKSWQSNYLSYKLLECQSCHFFGNPISLYSKLNDETYAESLLEFEEKINEDLKNGKDYLKNQHNLHNLLDKLRPNPELVDHFLFSIGININSKLNKTLLNNLKFIKAEDIPTLKSLTHNPNNKREIPEEDVVIIPLYLKYPFISSLKVLSLKRKNPITIYVTNGKYTEGGFLDFSPDSGEVLMIEDVKEGIQILNSFSVRSPAKEPPLCFYDQNSFFSFDFENKDRLIKADEKSLSSIISLFKVNKSTLITTQTLKQIQKIISEHGPNALNEIRQNSFKSIDIFSEVEPTEDLLKAIAKSTDTTENLIYVTKTLPTEKDKKNFINITGINPAPDDFYVDDTYAYKRHSEDGALSRVKRDNPKVKKTIAECSVVVKQIIHVEDSTIYHCSFMSKDIHYPSIFFEEDEIESKNLEKCIAYMARESSTTIPSVDMSFKNWFYTCLSLSNPEITTMYRHPTLTFDNRIYMPGRVISGDSNIVSKKNYIYPIISKKKVPENTQAGCGGLNNHCKPFIYLGLLSELLPVLSDSSNELILLDEKIKDKDEIEKFIEAQPLIMGEEEWIGTPQKYSSLFRIKSFTNYLVPLCWGENPILVDVEFSLEDKENLPKSIFRSVISFVTECGREYLKNKNEYDEGNNPALFKLINIANKLIDIEDYDMDELKVGDLIVGNTFNKRDKIMWPIIASQKTDEPFPIKQITGDRISLLCSDYLTEIIKYMPEFSEDYKYISQQATRAGLKVNKHNKIVVESDQWQNYCESLSDFQALSS